MRYIKQKEKTILQSFLTVLKVLAFIAIFFVVSQVLIPISDLLLRNWDLDNWGIGIIGMMIFDVLYIVPSDKSFLFRFKLLYLLGIMFFLAWFLADAQAFITTMINLIQNPK